MSRESTVQNKMAYISSDAINKFRTSLRGQLITSGDADYDQAREIWNGMINKRPSLIVVCAGVSDVIQAINFAREHGLELAVRGGGHNVAGNAICDGGLVVDFSRMKSVRVDPKNRTARAEPGVVWGELDRETQEFALAVTGGLVSTTGVAGFTLGGGVGWLVRKYGLALDNLVSADVVTAKGELVRASETENSDLFWGLRGGGGNFGVVTSFEFKLHPVGPILLGGMVIHPIEKGKDVLRFYREFVKNTPEELTTLAALITAPPAPFLPQQIHNKQVVAILGCYCGSVEEGERALKSLRTYSSGIDMFQPMPYRVLQSFLDEAAPPHIQNYWKSEYLSELGDQAIDTILEYNAKVPSPLTAIHIHQLGGAMSRVPDEATAFSNRKANFILNIVGSWLDQKDNDQNIRWVRDFFSKMEEYSNGSVYVNFLGQEGPERVKMAYGESNYGRLAELKKKYDPTNFFHVNQNIRPA